MKVRPSLIPSRAVLSGLIHTTKYLRYLRVSCNKTGSDPPIIALPGFLFEPIYVLWSLSGPTAVTYVTEIKNILGKILGLLNSFCLQMILEYRR